MIKDLCVTSDNPVYFDEYDLNSCDYKFKGRHKKLNTDDINVDYIEHLRTIGIGQYIWTLARYNGVNYIGAVNLVEFVEYKGEETNKGMFDFIMKYAPIKTLYSGEKLIYDFYSYYIKKLGNN